MRKKLFKVTVETEILILAESEAEAIIDAPDYAANENVWNCVSDLITSEKMIPPIWKNCLVYGNHGIDISTEEAFEISSKTLDFEARLKMTDEEKEALAQSEADSIGQLTFNSLGVNK